MTVFPDYSRSPANIAASFLHHYGAACQTAGVPEVDSALAGGARHTVLLVFDGLGTAQLEQHLPPDSFLRKHTIATVTSVFPPTTAAAMNSYYSGLPPLRHAWLGWSLYFREAGRAVDIFPRTDSMTREKVQPPFDPWELMSYKSVPDMIEEADAETKASFIAPQNIAIPGSRAETSAAADTDAVFESVRRRSASAEKKFTLGYWHQPDALLHRAGCFSAEAAACIADINSRCEALARSVQDTVFVISADHGHAQITQYVELEKIPGFAECLVVPPFLEARAAMFFIRNEKRHDFEAIYERELSADFMLFNRNEMLGKDLFGSGPAHPKALDFAADYLIAAAGSRAVKYYHTYADHSRDFPSHHAGLTGDEMNIPLVVFRA